MSYRDAEYPGQEDSGPSQYWDKQDRLEQSAYHIQRCGGGKVDTIKAIFRLTLNKEFNWSALNHKPFRRYLRRLARGADVDMREAYDWLREEGPVQYKGPIRVHTSGG